MLHYHSQSGNVTWGSLHILCNLWHKLYTLSVLKEQGQKILCVQCSRTNIAIET